MTRRPAVRPGDLIVFSGTPHLIATVDERNVFGEPIARTADGWGITLDSDGSLNIPNPNDRWCHIPKEEA